MNILQKHRLQKTTENGDVSYTSTGNNYIDLIFMADFFTKYPEEVTFGNTDRDKLFAMYMRDPREGEGRKRLGRKLLELAEVNAEHIVLSGTFADLWKIPTDDNLLYLYKEAQAGNALAKKWLPRLTNKDGDIAKLLTKYWKLTEKEYRALIKEESTTEYKLSYCEESSDTTPLNKIFKQGNYIHPLVDSIEFEKVPSLAMTKYIKAFSTRLDTKERFELYMNAVQENKAKINTKTATVHDALKVSSVGGQSVETNTDILGKKIVETNTKNLSLSCICVLDTSGSMGYFESKNSLCAKATSIAHALATNSSYAKNQVISFSSRPRLMNIQGKTLREQYLSMQTGDITNTNLIAVMNILKGLKEFPKYIIVMSDMEFDRGSVNSKDDLMDYIHELGADTKLIWWNFNDRNRTTPELDKYGNYYMSGFNLQALLMLPGVIDMEEYINALLTEYKTKLNLNYSIN